MIARAVVIALVTAGSAFAQPAVRRLTTVDGIRQYPGYFHLQPVVVRGELAESDGRVTLRSDEHEMRVLLDGPPAGAGKARLLDGPVEVRAQLIDVGRLEPGDPRVGDYEQRDRERWPRPGEELILRALGVAPAQAHTSPSIRALALEPWKFQDQRVTLVGQFRGRNLFGDQPDAPKKSRYDFVLKMADASVWVTGLRARGKGFDLNVDRRVDTSTWVEVSGLVRQEHGLVTIEATRIVSAEAPAMTAPEEPPMELPPPPPVDVVFSSPSEGETDVPPTSPIRVQFSRGIEPETLKGRIRIGYAGAESLERGEPQPPAIDVKTVYDPGTHALELTFTRPLERFRTVRVELLDGIKAFDGAPVTPWTLTFSVGG
ncbi:MAG: Ig-like domain-containing protein [Vicinamibacterales bacterium]